jgi:phenylacetate-coenzyme A ligase PaaK-like adenylate-forming protein
MSGQSLRASSRDRSEPIEGASLDELRTLQLARLKEALARAVLVPQYRKKFAETGVANLKHLDDLRGFPFTTKEDLRQNYPFGMFAVPMTEIVRIHASSGTTGKPTVVGYTRGDIELWSALMARSIRAAGGRPGDKMHVAYGYGLFTGGLGFHYGAEHLGCTVIPVSGRAMRRMDRIKGQSDDMLIIRGVNIFPSQIEAALACEEAFAPHYILEVTRPRRLDELEVIVETRTMFDADATTALADRAVHLIKLQVGVSTKVRAVAPGTIERSQGKAKRVIDKRPR